LRAQDVEILCDYVAYGALVAPKQAREYEAALKNSTGARKKNVRLTVMNDERLRTYTPKFVADEKQPREVRPERRLDVSNFLQSVAGMPRDDAAHANVATFIEARIANEHATLARLKETVHDPQALDDEFSVYYWIFDQERAIFSFPALSRDAIEYGFETSDQALIAALSDLGQRLRTPRP